MPLLQRLQHAPVLGEADIVRDQRVVADVEQFGHRKLLCSFSRCGKGARRVRQVEFAAPPVP